MASVPKTFRERLRLGVPIVFLFAAFSSPALGSEEDVDECTLLQTSKRTATGTVAGVLGAARKALPAREADAGGDVENMKLGIVRAFLDLAARLVPKRLLLLSQAGRSGNTDALPAATLLLVFFVVVLVVALCVLLLQALGTGDCDVDERNYPPKHTRLHDAQKPLSVSAAGVPARGQSVQYGMLQTPHVPPALVASLPSDGPPTNGRTAARSLSPLRVAQRWDVRGTSPPRSVPAVPSVPSMPMVQPLFRGNPPPTDLSASLPVAAPCRPPRMPTSQSMPPQVYLAPPAHPQVPMPQIVAADLHEGAADAASDLEFGLPSLKNGTAGGEQVQYRVLDGGRNPRFLAVLGAPTDRQVEFIALSEWGADRNPVGLCELWLPRDQECSGPRCSILAPGGVPFATIEEEPFQGIAGHRSFVVSADDGGHMLLKIQGRAGSRSHRIESTERVMAAIVEPGFDEEGIEYYWLRAAPGTDAGLCVLALLALDRIQHYR